MSYEQVDIYALEDSTTGVPVPGVLVRVYDETGTFIHGESVTDDAGRVGFLLWTQKYSLRFYKFGARVQQPQIIEVLEPPLGSSRVNGFDVKVVSPGQNVAADHRLCRASGFFRDVTGAPDSGIEMSFIASFSPILLEHAAVLGERRNIRTDRTGFGSIDLIRCARYQVIIQGSEVQTRCVEVPDFPSVNLPDLLFPVVEKIVFEEPVPALLARGSTAVLRPTVLASNLVPLLGTATADVVWSSSDEAVLSIAVEEKTITITAKVPGTAQLTAKRLDPSIIRIPNTPVQGVPVSITVW
jgi:hypothetical protein